MIKIQKAMVNLASIPNYFAGITELSISEGDARFIIQQPTNRQAFCTDHFFSDKFRFLTVPGVFLLQPIDTFKQEYKDISPGKEVPPKN